jgi:hypothetical protein
MQSRCGVRASASASAILELLRRSMLGGWAVSMELDVSIVIRTEGRAVLSNYQISLCIEFLAAAPLARAVSKAFWKERISQALSASVPRSRSEAC